MVLQVGSALTYSSTTANHGPVVAGTQANKYYCHMVQACLKVPVKFTLLTEIQNNPMVKYTRTYTCPHQILWLV